MRCQPTKRRRFWEYLSFFFKKREMGMKEEWVLIQLGKMIVFFWDELDH